MISVLILTKNEEQELPGCLESVRWSDDVHVYDSYSSDRTVEIAKAAGAHVTQRHFDNWAGHQNWGLENIAFANKWVFYLDADERVTPELAASLQKAVREPGEAIGFRVQRRDFWGTRWLKHVQACSSYLRLFRPEKLHYERLANPVSIADGPVADVSGYLNHYPFSKGMSHWLERHNSYSSLEAQQIIRNQKLNQKPSWRQAIFAKELSVRRLHQKELFYRMPGRPFIKFFILYFGKMGFLDGGAGFSYALLQYFYELMISLKTKELEQKLSTTEVAHPATGYSVENVERPR